MKYVITILISLTTLTFFITGCGESDDTQTSTSSSSDSSSSTSDVLPSKVYVEVCSDVSDDGFTQIEAGDDLVSEEANTTVKILQYQDNSKTVCIKSGKAHLLR